MKTEANPKDPLDLDELKAAGLNSRAESERLLAAHRAAEARSIAPPYTPSSLVKRAAVRLLCTERCPACIERALQRIVAALKRA